MFLRTHDRRFECRPVDGMLADAVKNADPTGTADLRRRYSSLTAIRWRRVKAQLRMAIQTQDMLALGADNSSPLSIAMRALPQDGILRAFQVFIDKVLLDVVLEHDTTYLDPMVSIAYARGAARAQKLSQAVRSEKAADHVAQLQQLVMMEQQGINEAVSQQIVRAVADGLLMQQSKAKVYAAAVKVVDKVGIVRSSAMVEFIIVKAHATATLDTFEAAGVKRVILLPENVPQLKRRIGDAEGFRSRLPRNKLPSASTIRTIRQREKKLERLRRVDIVTAGDERVCPICEDLEGAGPYSINEARSLIPAHSRCRCAFTSA